MNDSHTSPRPVSGDTWPGHEHRVPVADTSMLPGTEKAPTAAVDLLNRAVQGAHATIDRLADSAAPTVRKLGERFTGADNALQAKAGQLREVRDEWTESVRSTVRSNPLASVAGALALGVLIVRITR